LRVKVRAQLQNTGLVGGVELVVALTMFGHEELEHPYPELSL